MVFLSHSQNISKGESKVSIEVNTYGDTVVLMSISDAKKILEDILHYEYTDSLLSKYEELDSLKTIELNLSKGLISNLQLKDENNERIIVNLNEIISNKDEELNYKENIIKHLKKEVRKQKILKMIGFAGSIILPIITLLLLV